MRINAGVVVRGVNFLEARRHVIGSDLPTYIDEYSVNHCTSALSKHVDLFGADTPNLVPKFYRFFVVRSESKPI